MRTNEIQVNISNWAANKRWHRDERFKNLVKRGQNVWFQNRHGCQCESPGKQIIKAQHRYSIMDKKSNIVDLLRASVSVPEDVKPPGYTAFIQALRQINVPSYFYLRILKCQRTKESKR